MEQCGWGGEQLPHPRPSLGASAPQFVCVCDHCDATTAQLFCMSDGVFLCDACDTEIHSNRIAMRHYRVPYTQCPDWAYRDAKTKGRLREGVAGPAAPPPRGVVPMQQQIQPPEPQGLQARHHGEHLAAGGRPPAPPASPWSTTPHQFAADGALDWANGASRMPRDDPAGGGCPSLVDLHGPHSQWHSHPPQGMGLLQQGQHAHVGGSLHGLVSGTFSSGQPSSAPMPRRWASMDGATLSMAVHPPGSARSAGAALQQQQALSQAHFAGRAAGGHHGQAPPSSAPPNPQLLSLLEEFKMPDAGCPEALLLELPASLGGMGGERDGLADAAILKADAIMVDARQHGPHAGGPQLGGSLKSSATGFSGSSLSAMADGRGAALGGSPVDGGSATAVAAHGRRPSSGALAQPGAQSTAALPQQQGVLPVPPRSASSTSGTGSAPPPQQLPFNGGAAAAASLAASLQRARSMPGGSTLSGGGGGDRSVHGGTPPIPSYPPPHHAPPRSKPLPIAGATAGSSSSGDAGGIAGGAAAARALQPSMHPSDLSSLIASGLLGNSSFDLSSPLGRQLSGRSDGGAFRGSLASLLTPDNSHHGAGSVGSLLNGGGLGGSADDAGALALTLLGSSAPNGLPSASSLLASVQSLPRGSRMELPLRPSSVFVEAASAAAIEARARALINSASRNPTSTQLDPNVCMRIERPDGTFRELDAERAVQIHRYKQKRAARLKAYADGQRKVRYECRKHLADTRPRVRGRFAKAGSYDCLSMLTSSDLGSSMSGGGDGDGSTRGAASAYAALMHESRIDEDRVTDPGLARGGHSVHGARTHALERAVSCGGAIVVPPPSYGHGSMPSREERASRSMPQRSVSAMPGLGGMGNPAVMWPPPGPPPPLGTALSSGGGGGLQSRSSQHTLGGGAAPRAPHPAGSSLDPSSAGVSVTPAVSGVPSASSPCPASSTGGGGSPQAVAVPTPAPPPLHDPALAADLDAAIAAAYQVEALTVTDQELAALGFAPLGILQAQAQAQQQGPPAAGSDVFLTLKSPGHSEGSAESMCMRSDPRYVGNKAGSRGAPGGHPAMLPLLGADVLMHAPSHDGQPVGPRRGLDVLDDTGMEEEPGDGPGGGGPTPMAAYASMCMDGFSNDFNDNHVSVMLDELLQEQCPLSQFAL